MRWSWAPAARACARRCSSPRPASRSRCCPRCSRRARTPSRRRAASARALGNMGEDNWHWHMYDTVKGSDYLGDQDAIEFMCRKAPEVGVSSSSTSACRSTATTNGKIYQRPFGGHIAEFRRAPGAAHLLRGRPHRPRHAAHAVPAQRARQHPFLRRVDGARPDPRRRRRRCSA